MTCTEIRPMLVDYLDSSLTGEKAFQVSRHLEQCDSCQEEYIMLKDTRELVTSKGRREPPGDLALKIREAITESRARRHGSSSVYALRLYALFDSFFGVSEEPPVMAEFFLLMVPMKNREGALGDLEEEFRTISVPRLGLRKAHIVFWSQVFWIVLPFFWQRIRRLTGLAFLWKLLH